MPIVEVDNIAKSFDGRTILDGISFNVERGQTLVLLGRSGTGKSVTLKTLMGLIDPDEGIAKVFGKCLATMTEKQRLRQRSKIGYVFQGGALFDSLSVGDNVGFPLFQRGVPDDEIREKVLERLRMVGLAHTVDQRPSDLSGGMQKRVALARAIIDLPAVVLYDEPTSGLDPLTTDVINQLILRLRSTLGVTSIVVTHDIDSAFTIADHIVMLDKGRVLASGTPSEIRASELPWVQHFISGRALEGERIDSGLFGSALRNRAIDHGTQRFPATAVLSSTPQSSATNLNQATQVDTPPTTSGRPRPAVRRKLRQSRKTYEQK